MKVIPALAAMVVQRTLTRGASVAEYQIHIRRATIARARHLLGQTAPTTSVADSPPADRDRTCPVCRQGQWQIVAVLRPLVRAPGHGLWNTS